MGVQSYLMLYTMMLGWQVYDGLWSILTQLGLTALPLGFIAIKCFVDPMLSMPAKQAGVSGAKNFSFKLILALFVMVFTCVPMVYLQPQVITFEPMCSTNPKVATPGNTGTTYDASFKQVLPSNIKVPIWWYAVLSVSNGITDQAKQLLACPNVNLRALQSRLNLATIQDPKLKAEVKEFNNDCYIPAYNKYMVENRDVNYQTEIAQSLKKYGQDDVSWVGSETFQTVSGFYDRFFSGQPIQGFPYVSTNINDKVAGQLSTPKWGMPSCRDWWQKSDVGLRDRLFKQLSGTLRATLDTFQQYYAHSGDIALVHNAVVKQLLEQSTGGSTLTRAYSSEEDYKGGLDNFWGKYAAKGGTDFYALFEYPKIHMIENAVPIVQAVLLFLVIMLLAIVLPMSSYSVKTVTVSTVFLFGLIFLGFIEHSITWLDQFLLQALYGVGDTGSNSSFLSIIHNMGSQALSPGKNLLDLTISMFYVLAPFLWMSMASWAGISLGNSIVGMMDIKESGGMVGGKTSALATSGFKRGARGVGHGARGLGRVAKAGYGRVFSR